MVAILDVCVALLVLSLIGYGLYRIIVGEKEKDINRKEEEIKRKDLEIERLKKELDVYKVYK